MKTRWCLICGLQPWRYVPTFYSYTSSSLDSSLSHHTLFLSRPQDALDARAVVVASKGIIEPMKSLVLAQNMLGSPPSWCFRSAMRHGALSALFTLPVTSRICHSDMTSFEQLVDAKDS